MPLYQPTKEISVSIKYFTVNKEIRQENSATTNTCVMLRHKKVN